MSAFKEIVTKAVIGKGKKYYKNSYTIETEYVPTTVLGCWVINHTFKGTDVGGKIVIDGSFDVNIWYSYDNDTKTTVITKKITYSESVTVRQRETTDSATKDIVIRSLKQPSCINAKENGKTITIEIEKELGIEVVGDTKIKVAIEEEEEPWDLIEDTEYTEEVEKEIDSNVKEDYLKKDYLKNNKEDSSKKE
ncbi:MAG: outer spore coat protein CotE [Erysipelotrichaceae bacterium]|nr:outer spore coat protein CotE [Erysipelotrichaceae bacterium]